MKRINSIILCAVLGLLLINLSACEKLSSFEHPPSLVSAYQIIANDGNYSYFKTVVDKAGLADMFKGGNKSTFFIPTNGAFLNAGYTLSVLQNLPVADVEVIAKNHILPTHTDVSAAGAAQEQTTLGGLKVSVQNIGTSSFVDGGDIMNRNQIATNGYVNIINKVLVSKGSVQEVISTYSHATVNSQLTFLAAAIGRASTGSTNIAAILSGSNAYTFFAPNNGAFIDAGYASIAAINAAAPDALGTLLRNHLIAGTKLTTAFDSLPDNASSGMRVYFDRILRAPKTTTTRWYANGISFGNGVPSNLRAGNGVVHIIPRMLPVPVQTTTLARINADASLSMFSALISRASAAEGGLNFVSLLSDPLRTYTVFAVNNTGLQAAGYSDVAAINSANPAVLAEILKLHMVAKRINNINIADNGGVETLHYTKNVTTGISEPTNLTFSLTSPVSSGFRVKGPSNMATIPVISPNIATTNGILNTIGTLLTP